MHLCVSLELPSSWDGIECSTHSCSLWIHAGVWSPAVIKVCDKDWVEPVILRITICMPTGSDKSTLFKHLMELLQKIQQACGVTEDDPSWIFDHASFEKMGALNSCRLFGFYDELTSFLSQINLYHGKGLLDTHKMAIFI